MICNVLWVGVWSFAQLSGAALSRGTGYSLGRAASANERGLGYYLGEALKIVRWDALPCGEMPRIQEQLCMQYFFGSRLC